MAITTPQVTQPRTIPYTAPGQPVQYVNQPAPQVQAPQPVQAPQTQPAGMNQQVLQAGQQKAIQGFQSPTMDMTSQATQGLLQNPNAGGMDWQKYQQSQMEQFDTNRAQSMDAAKQQLAPAWNTGGAMGQFMDLALKGATERSTMEQGLKKEAAAGTQENLYRALQEGRQTSEAERQRFATDIGALAQVRDMAEGQENREFQGSQNAMDRGMQIALANQNAELQTGLTELKGKIDQGMLLQTQDFQGVQNQLDRELQNAISSGNWQNALQIEQLRGEIQAQQAEAQRQWQTGERVATQSWSTSERIDDQGFQTGMQYLKQQQALALQDNDIQNARYLQDQQGLLQLKMQTNDMQYGEKMAYLNSQLEEARANNDVGRQKEVIKFQSGQEMERIIQQQGWEEAQTYIRQEHDLALQQGDLVKAETLQRNEFEFRRSEAVLDRAIEQMKVDLQEKGMNMDQLEQQYAMIQNQIDAGTLDPKAGYEFLVNSLQQSGVDVSRYNYTDALTQEKIAIQAEYDAMRSQYAMTHPEFVDRATGQLTPEGYTAFNAFANKTFYGELTPEEKAAKAVSGYLDHTDLSSAATGDKFNIAQDYSYNGVKIPAGQYSVEQDQTTKGSTFWGTKQQISRTYLIDQNTGKRLLINTVEGNKEGNLVSNLWAGTQ
jgi:hypothetical protein